MRDPYEEVVVTQRVSRQRHQISIKSNQVYRWTMDTTLKLTAISLATVFALAGCQTGQKDSIGDFGVQSPEIGYSGSSEASVNQIFEAPSDQASSPLQLEPSVITTGYLSLIVQSPSDSADEISTIVTDSGGRVASRSDYSPIDFGQPSSYLEVRIPAERLAVTLEAIEEVGQVQDVSVNTVDVSLQKMDLDARIQVLEASMARLTELLASANNTADLIAIETALSDRQAELDSLTSQLSYLSDQTLFATISINLATPADARPTDPDGFLDGLMRGWESILAFFAGVIVWAGIIVPWLGLVVVFVLVIWVIRRLVKRNESRHPENRPQG
jgi:uncharacterized coiled-coil protein SlyX